MITHYEDSSLNPSDLQKNVPKKITQKINRYLGSARSSSYLSMKGHKDSINLPRKVRSRQRQRSTRAEEESRKRQVTREEICRLRRVQEFVSEALVSSDPFTALEIESQIIPPKGSRVSVSPYFKDFKESVLEPQKSKKSKLYSEFAELKKQFDLLNNKEDTEIDSLTAKRYAVYLQHLNSNPTAASLLQLLQTARNTPRKQCIQAALDLKEEAQIPNKNFLKTEGTKLGLKKSLQALSGLQKAVMRNFAVENTDLSLEEKTVILKHLPKHMKNWEKIRKEFKEDPPDIPHLKNGWRKLKGNMIREVQQIKQTHPEFSLLKWMRAAQKKQDCGGKKPIKNGNVIDATFSARRMDILSVMAQVDEQDTSGIESNQNLCFSSISSFKPYSRDCQSLLINNY